VNFGAKDNTLNETILDVPLLVDQNNLMSSVGEQSMRLRSSTRATTTTVPAMRRVC
jgi:hypothetical protein